MAAHVLLRHALTLPRRRSRPPCRAITRPMSDENVQVVRRLIDAVNADDVPRDLMTEDVELKNAPTAVTEATYIGYEGALKWRQDFFEVVEDARYELDDVI